MGLFTGPPRKPWGLKWRSSVPFITAVIGVGITMDLLVYSIIVPVMPFQLEKIGYHSVSALTGWLLFAYSAGVVLSTIPIAIFAERTSSRRIPLVIGSFCLLAAQVLLMEAPNYPLMAIARFLQGISSSMTWIVGLALICDTTPEQNVGSQSRILLSLLIFANVAYTAQLGLATTGLSIGIIAGSPAGGGLYDRFGFRGPFVFGEICALVVLLLLLFVVERDAAIKWGHDPTESQEVNVVADLEGSSSVDRTSDVARLFSSCPSPGQTPALVDPKSESHPLDPPTSAVESPTTTETPLIPKPLSTLSVMRLLGKSSRALVALIMSLVYATVTTMQEPTLPLHLQAVWGYTSGKVGLVYMAGLVPTVISGPLAGFLSDRIGQERVATLCILLTLPWLIVMSLRKSAALFIVSLAVQCFFFSGINPSLNAELAAVSRRIPGVGYAHVYGAFNLAFGVGAALGPIIGGQVYAALNDGWPALCYIVVAILAICTVPVICFMGDETMLSRMRRRLKQRARATDDLAAQAFKSET